MADTLRAQFDQTHEHYYTLTTFINKLSFKLGTVSLFPEFVGRKKALPHSWSTWSIIPNNFKQRPFPSVTSLPGASPSNYAATGPCNQRSEAAAKAPAEFPGSQQLQATQVWSALGAPGPGQESSSRGLGKLALQKGRGLAGCTAILRPSPVATRAVAACEPHGFPRVSESCHQAVLLRPQ